MHDLFSVSTSSTYYLAISTIILDQIERGSEDNISSDTQRHGLHLAIERLVAHHHRRLLEVLAELVEASNGADDASFLELGAPRHIAEGHAPRPLIHLEGVTHTQR